MLDCRGKILREGDLVAIGLNAGILVVGTLEHDPDDIRWGRLAVRISPQTVKRIDKVSSRIVSITAQVNEVLDRPIVL